MCRAPITKKGLPSIGLSALRTSPKRGLPRKNLYGPMWRSFAVFCRTLQCCFRTKSRRLEEASWQLLVVVSKFGAKFLYRVVSNLFTLLTNLLYNYTAAMADRRLRLLCLDGGGIRGLASLYLLKKILSRVGNPKPCEFFDMICGTSTGG